MFATDDSDDDEDDEDEDDMIGGLGRGQSLFSDTLGIGRPRSPDVTLNLKAQLDDFEKAIVDNEVDGDTHEGNDEKGDAPFGTDGLHEDDAKTPHAEASPPPKPSPNGDVKPVEQLKYEPGGDEPSPAVKAEGLMDGTEDPTKT